MHLSFIRGEGRLATVVCVDQFACSLGCSEPFFLSVFTFSAGCLAHVLRKSLKAVAKEIIACGSVSLIWRREKTA